MTKKIVTHSESFHSDDIFAVATLLLVYPDAEIIRSRESVDWERADVVVDVGGVYDASKMRFDHHQLGGAGKRSNGIPYASFGLVWKHFGEALVGSEGSEIIDLKLVAPTDAIDNGIDLSDPSFEGVREYSIHDFLFSHVNSSISDTSYLLETFIKLVGIARDLLSREIENTKTVVIGRKRVREIVEQTLDKRIIILPEDLPWGKVLVDVPDALYVVYPRSDGSWGVKAVHKGPNGFESRKLLPIAWRAKRDEEFEKISGVVGAKFCHHTGFMCTGESKEGATALARKALDA